MKKSLLVVIALLCMASLMAAMAYTSAIVTNAASLTVENTTGSLLGLTVKNGVGNKDNTAWIGDDGRLYFDFAKGTGNHYSNWQPKNWGLQPGSTYIWDELFNVSNNSIDHVVYRIDASEELLPYITVRAVNAAGARIDVPFVINGVNNTNGLGLPSKDTCKIAVSFTIPEDFKGNLSDVFNGTLTVKARVAESVNRHNPITY